MSRKPSQQIMIGNDIQITVVKIDRNQVRLGIQAPQGVPILREELVGLPPASEQGLERPAPIRIRRGPVVGH